MNRILDFIFYLPMTLGWWLLMAWKMAKIGFWPFDWEVAIKIRPIPTHNGKKKFRFLWKNFDFSMIKCYNQPRKKI